MMGLPTVMLVRYWIVDALLRFSLLLFRCTPVSLRTYEKQRSGKACSSTRLAPPKLFSQALAHVTGCAHRDASGPNWQHPGPVTRNEAAARQEPKRSDPVGVCDVPCLRMTPRFALRGTGPFQEFSPTRASHVSAVTAWGRFVLRIFWAVVRSEIPVVFFIFIFLGCVVFDGLVPVALAAGWCQGCCYQVFNVIGGGSDQARAGQILGDALGNVTVHDRLCRVIARLIV